MILFVRDFQQKDKEKAIIEREQALSELRVWSQIHSLGLVINHKIFPQTTQEIILKRRIRFYKILIQSLLSSFHCPFVTSFQVRIGAKKVIPLSRLRGSVRPVIILGNKSYIQKSLRSAQREFLELRERGVSGNLVLLYSSQISFRGVAVLS